MWLACLAIAVYHISVLQAVQKEKNQYAKFNKRTGNMMFSYIFNEPQMTLLFILSSIYGREMYSSMKKNLQWNELHKFRAEVLPYSIITIYLEDSDILIQCAQYTQPFTGLFFFLIKAKVYSLDQKRCTVYL